ncbi:DUF4282 domain-containing protein [Brevibacterium sp. S22]|uniref:DUF4282 domain-containing protein n=1 Tax=Brevibacterium sp. S22 TaxID=2483794 RepID=UPI001092FE48|nr:DUF4282 domain-containing protein [Brevibacterium sp. S22]TGD27770.1 DUF4282 domain-containing protein [Brevibacterium sp. S22]
MGSNQNADHPGDDERELTEQAIRHLSSFSASNFADSNIEPTTLALLAEHRHDLWPSILRHPQCYPELAHWINQKSAEARSSSDNRAHYEQWLSHFQIQNGRNPTEREYKHAVASGLILDDCRDPNASAPQTPAGDNHLATGTKQFFNPRVTPSTPPTVASADQETASGSGMRRKQARFFDALVDASFNTYISVHWASILYRISIVVAGITGLVAILIGLEVSQNQDEIGYFFLGLVGGICVPLIWLILVRLILEFSVATIQTAKQSKRSNELLEDLTELLRK